MVDGHRIRLVLTYITDRLTCKAARKNFPIQRSIIRHSNIRDFLIKKFSVYSPIELWYKITTRDCSVVRAPMRIINRCGVCPHADHHENLSFIVRIAYK